MDPVPQDVPVWVLRPDYLESIHSFSGFSVHCLVVMQWPSGSGVGSNATNLTTWPSHFPAFSLENGKLVNRYFDVKKCRHL